MSPSTASRSAPAIPPSPPLHPTYPPPPPLPPAVGDVVLNNLQLRPEALAALKLPITVRAGVLGSLRIKVGGVGGSGGSLPLPPDGWTRALPCRYLGAGRDWPLSPSSGLGLGSRDACGLAASLTASALQTRSARSGAREEATSRRRGRLALWVGRPQFQHCPLPPLPQIPWNQLGKKPVQVEADHIFLIAVPNTTGGDAVTEEEAAAGAAAEREAKRRRLAAAEQAWMDALKAPRKDAKKAEEAEKTSWFQAFAATIIGNVQVRPLCTHCGGRCPTPQRGMPRRHVHGAVRWWGGAV